MISSNEQYQDESVSSTTSCKCLPMPSFHPQLTELNLSKLQLRLIDSFPFEQFPNLHSLDLSYNQLTTINPDWSMSYENRIENLNLSHNKLETLLFLKDFKYLKSLNVTNNLLRNHERYLSLYICPTIDHMIDSNQEQIHGDRLKLDGLLFLIERNIDRTWSSLIQNKYKKDDKIPQSLFDDFRQLLIEIIEQQIFFSGFHLSLLGHYLLDKKIKEFRSRSSNRSFIKFLTDDFNRAVTIRDKLNISFKPKKFLRCHHTSNDDLLTTPIVMSEFEPNSSNNILATCGGQKVCFIDCDTCEVTHLFEINKLRLKQGQTNRKTKDKDSKSSIEHFSCLCWIELEDVNEKLNILAVGSTHGQIYLLSPKWKLMFGHIELPASSISCLTWHSSSPLTLVVGSCHIVRFVNIRSYVDRLQSFIRKQKKPTALFDYVDSSIFVNKVPITHVYNLYSGDGPLIVITDLLCCPLSNGNIVLLVGTTSGLFFIRYQDKREQLPIQLTFPKSIWTPNEYIESFRLIDKSLKIIAMNILGLDQICCFDLEKSLKDQQLSITLLLPNVNRNIATKIALCTTQNNDDNTNESFECIVGCNYNSFFYYQIQSYKTTATVKTKNSTFEYEQFEISHEENEISKPLSILSASLNEHYLSLTSNSNLICIYKRH